MSGKASGTKRWMITLTAIFLVLAFVERRTGLISDRSGGFNPEDYQDVPILSAGEAGAYVGDRVVVCGTVVRVTFAQATRGQPTFLNLDRPYPDQPFDLVVWGHDRQHFPEAPETLYQDQRICAAGRVSEHRDIPRIEVTTPRQVRVAPGQEGESPPP